MTKARGGSKLKKGQERAIAALLTSPSHDEAAKAAGISPSTLARWLNIPEFQSAYREARRQLVEFAVGKSQEATAKAVQTLLDAMQNADRWSDRIRAAQIVIDTSVGGLEVADVLERLEALEQEADGDGDGEGEAHTPQA